MKIVIENREYESRSQDISRPSCTCRKIFCEGRRDRCDCLCHSKPLEISEETKERLKKGIHKAMKKDPDQISKRMEDCLDEAKRIMVSKYKEWEPVDTGEFPMQELITVAKALLLITVATALFNAGWRKE